VFNLWVYRFCGVYGGVGAVCVWGSRCLSRSVFVFRSFPFSESGSVHLYKEQAYLQPVFSPGWPSCLVAPSSVTWFTTTDNTLMIFRFTSIGKNLDQHYGHFFKTQQV